MVGATLRLASGRSGCPAKGIVAVGAVTSSFTLTTIGDADAAWSIGQAAVRAF